ncbi:MAG: molybdopterin-dependent oxidoreductase, partial [Deltaproteobacteria bacterium]|nr:molybdopterin-dependent oxidoreductase [Deltaproteobacteria bacterium]
VVSRDAIDHERVGRYMKGLEALRKVCEPWSPDRTAEVTSVSAETLRSMVDTYLAADGAALFLSTGVNQGSQGTLAFWIQEAINAITGNLDRLGGTLVGHGYIKDFARHARKGGRTMRKDLSRIGQLPSVVDTFPAGLMADEILTPGEGQVRAMFCVSGNPLLTVPNSNGRLDEALRALELLVVIDIFRNETANHAHYILPGTSAFQRADLPFVFQSLMGLQPIPYAQYTDALVPTEGEQRDETMILLQLARACGSTLFGSKIANGFFSGWLGLGKLPAVGSRLGLTPERFLALMARAFRLGSLKSLRKEPHGRLLEPNEGGDFLGQRVVTDDGLVDLAPEELVDAARKLEPFFEQERTQRDKLKLINKREQARREERWRRVGRHGRGTQQRRRRPAPGSAHRRDDGRRGSVAPRVGTPGSRWAERRKQDDGGERQPAGRRRPRCPGVFLGHGKTKRDLGRSRPRRLTRSAGVSVSRGGGWRRSRWRRRRSTSG